MNNTEFLAMVRFRAAFGVFICLTLLCCNSTRAAEHIALHVYTAIELKLIAESNRLIEQHSPKGSRVYSFDSYQVNEGPDSLTLGVDTTFRRDASGILYVTDMDSGYTWTFGRHAAIERKNNIGEQVLRPREAPSENLRHLLMLHGARFVKAVP